MGTVAQALFEEQPGEPKRSQRGLADQSADLRFERRRVGGEQRQAAAGGGRGLWRAGGVWRLLGGFAAGGVQEADAVALARAAQRAQEALEGLRALWRERGSGREEWME